MTTVVIYVVLYELDWTAMEKVREKQRIKRYDETFDTQPYRVRAAIILFQYWKDFLNVSGFSKQRRMKMWYYIILYLVKPNLLLWGLHDYVLPRDNPVQTHFTRRSRRQKKNLYL